MLIANKKLCYHIRGLARVGAHRIDFGGRVSPLFYWGVSWLTYMPTQCLL